MEIPARRETGMGAPSEGTARLEKDEKEQAFKPTPELQGGGWERQEPGHRGPGGRLVHEKRSAPYPH